MKQLKNLFDDIIFFMVFALTFSVFLYPLGGFNAIYPLSCAPLALAVLRLFGYRMRFKANQIIGLIFMAMASLAGALVFALTDFTWGLAIFYILGSFMVDYIIIAVYGD